MSGNRSDNCDWVEIYNIMSGTLFLATVRERGIIRAGMEQLKDLSFNLDRANYRGLCIVIAGLFVALAVLEEVAKIDIDKVNAQKLRSHLQRVNGGTF